MHEISQEHACCNLQETAKQAQLDKLLNARLARIKQGKATFYTVAEAKAKTRLIVQQQANL